MIHGEKEHEKNMSATLGWLLHLYATSIPYYLAIIAFWDVLEYYQFIESMDSFKIIFPLLLLEIF
jgi:hypothetical protein